MTEFLHLIPVAEAIHLINRISPTVDAETVPLTAAYGRILAEDVQTDTDIPGFDRSVKDGFAVNAADTVRASEAAPVPLTRVGQVVMGRGGNGPAIRPGECVYIPTGGALPKGADAVVMLEYCQDLGETVLAGRQVSPGENIIRADEDYARGEGVLAAGKLLMVQDIGVLAAVGVSRVAVRKRPVIGIVPTGVELVPPDQVPDAGEVRDVNSYLCGAFVKELGGVPRYYDIVRDDRAELAALLSSALDECDAFLITGGSSKDDRDITADVIGSLGEVLAHGWRWRPGNRRSSGRSGMRPSSASPATRLRRGSFLRCSQSSCSRSLAAPVAGRRREGGPHTEHPRAGRKGTSGQTRDEAVPLFGKSGLKHPRRERRLIRSSRDGRGSRQDARWT